MKCKYLYISLSWKMRSMNFIFPGKKKIYEKNINHFDIAGFFL